MKINKTIGAVTLVLGVAAAVQAQTPPPTGTPVYISGSTAFRAQVYAGLQDLGLSSQTGDSSSANTFTFTGTPNGTIVSGLPSGLLTGGAVTVYCSFDGSLQGVDALAHPSSHSDTFENIGGSSAGTFSHTADLAFSDVSQASAYYVDQSPVLNELISADATVSFTGLAVQPFLWGANAAATAKFNYINNIQIYSLLNDGVLDLSYWTGVATDFAAPLGSPTFEPPPSAKTVTLTGRDNSSGTRITAQQLANWNPATPINQYTINGVTSDPATLGTGLNWAYITNSGYSSGGKVTDSLEYPGTFPAVSYLSFSDAKTLPYGTAAFTGGATPVAGSILSYGGVNPVLSLGATYPTYNIAAVVNGQWPFWSYEHLYESINVVSGGYIDASFGPGLVDSIDYEIGLQKTTKPPQTAILEGDMNVYRSVDGGPVYPN
jgi:hypothetical protein